MLEKFPQGFRGIKKKNDDFFLFEKKIVGRVAEGDGCSYANGENGAEDCSMAW